MDYKEIGRIFFRDGYRLAGQYLEDDLSAVNLAEAIRQLLGSMDELLGSFLQRSAAEGRPAECRKGCSWCCHQKVYAVTHEFLFLGDYVNRHFSKETKMGILERSHSEAPCPFLENGSCLIYEARPMACRIYLSSSEKACKMVHDQPDNDAVIPELFEFPLKAGRMMNEGFVAYLKQLGVQSAELPLGRGYSSMLETIQTFDSWIDNSSSSR